jgi:hypothetical protein
LAWPPASFGEIRRLQGVASVGSNIVN